MIMLYNAHLLQDSDTLILKLSKLMAGLNVLELFIELVFS
jgi:hypothetical protein